MKDVSVRIAGLTGQGIEFATEVIVRACAMKGLNVYTFRWFPTIVRGGFTYSEIRISDEEVNALPDRIDVLAVLDESGLKDLDSLLSEDSIMLIDEGLSIPHHDWRVVRQPLKKASSEAKSRLNVVVVGFISGLLGLGYDVVSIVLEKISKKDLLESNLRGVEAGYKLFVESSLESFDLPSLSVSKSVVQGSDMVALGALSAGCKFFAGYPITPSTSIMEKLMKWLPEVGGLAVQVEDELSAVNMVIGASYAGARSMTATSGPGLSLMVEGIGFSAMAEIPIVVVDVQRVGPSTGIPTAYEQGDIDLATHPSHGDVPRIVLAPSTIEEYYSMTVTAFELADRYRCPVILLLDQVYVMNYFTLDKLEASRASGRKYVSRVRGEGLQVFPSYSGLADCIPSPPLDGFLVVASSVEHDVRGLSMQDGQTHVEMSWRRLGKLRELEENPVEWEVLGDTDSSEAIVSVGSCRGAVEEALEKVRGSGRMIMHIPLKQLWPLPRKLGETLRNIEKIYVVEQNASGQLLNLISSMLPKTAELKSIRKFDGCPFRPGEIYKGLVSDGGV
ncbi:MAG: 2-oxoacid:acceptor oxidoreductase subunit alpha [Thaumarchaeota archaeon]|nr:2-oxoacid:acceptor oxidoreductase subunit alpha [Candidatus Geocrenenecus arthurdayi]